MLVFKPVDGAPPLQDDAEFTPWQILVFINITKRMPLLERQIPLVKCLPVFGYSIHVFFKCVDVTVCNAKFTVEFLVKCLCFHGVGLVGVGWLKRIAYT